MTSIEIVNAAFTQLGCNPIASFDDGTAEGIVAKANYVSCRDYVLENREWTFAKSRLQLNEDATPPAFGLTHRYIIPSGVLKVVRCYADSGALLQPDDWVREGQFVLTNQAAPVYAEVLTRVDEGFFSPGMTMALIEYIKHVCAVPLTENAKASAAAFATYQAKISEAAAMDGSQGRMQKFTQPRLPGRRTHNLR